MYNQWLNNVLSKLDQKCSTVTTEESDPPFPDSCSPPPSLSERSLTAQTCLSHQSKVDPNQSLGSKIPGQPEHISSHQAVNKDLLQKGLTIMQLAIIEPQEQTSAALYEIALNKFICAQQGKMISVNPVKLGVDTPSRKNPLWSSQLTTQQQIPSPSDKEHQGVYEKTIWSQLLSVLLELSTLIMMVIHKTPLPGILSTMLLLCYRQLLFLETKYHIINFAVKQLGCLLYWIFDLCQHYNLPRYVAQIVYIIAMTIVHTGKTCLETE
ncbi:hypothetical protein [Absidia glauca]|uniref:Uncharacterized protein n=1 Tax=Absidia glauca TaxID=4829 RepID=A0A163KAX5_ABSGL|nr:hypothetical protein [Absidia glauca]